MIVIICVYDTESTLKLMHEIDFNRTKCLSLLLASLKNYLPFNPFLPKSDLIDLTLSNARRFSSSKGLK